MTASTKKLIIKTTKVIVRTIVIRLELEADDPFLSLKKNVKISVVIHISNIFQRVILEIHATLPLLASTLPYNKNKTK